MGETKPVRKGEEIDTQRLGAFLESELGLSGSEIDVEQFPAGSSNLTYLVRVGSDEYVLRRPPFGNTVATAHDMGREFRVLSKLSAVYAPAPRPVIFADDVSIIGSEFYLMERRRGLIIRGRIPTSRNVTVRERVDLSPPAIAWADLEKPGTQDQNYPQEPLGSTTHDLDTSQLFRRQVCESFISTLAELHSLDLGEAGLADLGKPEGYVGRQVEGWSKRYFAARTSDAPDLERTIVWLNENIPPGTRGCLIHNDYKFDNVMLDPADLRRVTAVLDWEMVTVGDPLMDLGTTLGYWMSRDAGEEMLNMPFNPRVLMENISRQELAEMYAKNLGRNLPDMLFYYVFGTFKIAVIAQQIYSRYVKGFTKDERFANFDQFVGSLGRIAAKALDRGAI
jgi:aminoglycoside phosphotransferase (APT) family kinase protein